MPSKTESRAGIGEDGFALAGDAQQEDARLTFVVLAQRATQLLKALGITPCSDLEPEYPWPEFLFGQPGARHVGVEVLEKIIAN